MSTVQLNFSGAEINSLLSKVDTPTAPASGNTNMINSGQVFTAVNNLDVNNIAATTLVTESEGIGSNDNDTTIPTSAAVKDYVDTNVTVPVASFTKASGTLTATGLITSYTEVDTTGFAAESSGTITVTGAGTYLVNFGGIFSEGGSGSFDLQYRVDGASVMNRTSTGDQETISYSLPKVISSGTFTIDIRGAESGVSTLTFSDVRVDIIKLA